VNGPDDSQGSPEPAAAEPSGRADARAEGRRIVAWLRQHRARLEILAIGAVALGGIVCMVLVTLLIVWRQANP